MDTILLGEFFCCAKPVYADRFILVYKGSGWRMRRSLASNILVTIRALFAQPVLLNEAMPIGIYLLAPLTQSTQAKSFTKKVGFFFI